MRAMRSLIVLCGKYEVDSTLLCSDAVALRLGTGVTQRLCGTRSLTWVPPLSCFWGSRTRGVLARASFSKGGAGAYIERPLTHQQEAGHRLCAVDFWCSCWCCPCSRWRFPRNVRINLAGNQSLRLKLVTGGRTAQRQVKLQVKLVLCTTLTLWSI